MSLHDKLLTVAKKLGAIGKDKTNTFHKYNYASAEAFIMAVRGPLLEEGVLILPNVTVQTTEIVEVQRKGGAGKDIHVVTNGSYTLTDGKETLTVSVPGEGVDSGDKATYKALTGGFKYLLRLLFLLPMLDDPEQYNPNEQSAPKSNAPDKRVAEIRERLEAHPAKEAVREGILGQCGVDAISKMTSDQLDRILAKMRENAS